MHKTAEAAGEFIENKIADKILKPKLFSGENSIDVEEIVIPLEKKRRSIEWLKTSIIKWNTIKYLNY